MEQVDRFPFVDLSEESKPFFFVVPSLSTRRKHHLVPPGRPQSVQLVVSVCGLVPNWCQFGPSFLFSDSDSGGDSDCPLSS